MDKPADIMLLPELSAWMRNQRPTEALAMERGLQRDGVLDSFKWARIKLDDGSVVSVVLDGHQRWMACQRLGIEMPKDKWELIEAVTTVQQARDWMFDFQAGRRNWSPNEFALQAAELYEERKRISGERTDVYGGKKIDTAEEVAERYGKTGRWVREAVAFAKAFEALRPTVSVDFQEELLSDQPPISRDQVVAIAAAPEAVQREALDLALKRNTKGLGALLDKAKELVEGTGGTRKAVSHKPAAERYDLAELVYLIDRWSIEMVKAYNPVTNVRSASYLSTHLGGAIAKLIVLAEENGLAGDVIDDYTRRRAGAAVAYSGTVKPPEEAEEPAAEDAAAPEPEAAPAALQATLEGPSAFRRAVVAAVDHMGVNMAELAHKAGVSLATVRKAHVGGKVGREAQQKIMAAITALAPDR